MDLDGRWTLAGNLNQARLAHNAIYDGEYLMIVGGSFERETEKCSVVDGSVDCLYQLAPELDDYYFYPELFLVSDDFCKK